MGTPFGLRPHSIPHAQQNWKEETLFIPLERKAGTDSRKDPLQRVRIVVAPVN